MEESTKAIQKGFFFENSDKNMEWKIRLTSGMVIPATFLACMMFGVKLLVILYVLLQNGEQFHIAMM